MSVALFKLSLKEQTDAILTADPEAIRAAYKLVWGSRAGRKKLLRLCPKCNTQLGGREMRRHKC